MAIVTLFAVAVSCNSSAHPKPQDPQADSSLGQLPAEPLTVEPAASITLNGVQLTLQPANTYTSPAGSQNLWYKVGLHSATQPTLDVDHPYSASLYFAAAHYALAAGDAEVSIADLLSAGSIPYMEAVDGLDRQLTITGAEVECLVPDWEVDLVGSPLWKLRIEATELEQFYRDHLKAVEDGEVQPLNRVTQSGRASSPSRLSNEWTAGLDLTPLPGFWNDPLTGTPMTRGNLRGQLREEGIWDIVRSKLRDCPIPYPDSTGLVFINEWDQPAKQTSDQTCCYLSWTISEIQAYSNQNTFVHCECGTTSWTCLVQWSYPCTAYMHMPNLRVGPCDDPRPGEEQIATCPTVSPVRSYITASCQGSASSTCGSHSCQAGTTEECDFDVDEFVFNVNTGASDPKMDAYYCQCE